MNRFEGTKQLRAERVCREEKSSWVEVVAHGYFCEPKIGELNGPLSFSQEVMRAQNEDFLAMDVPEFQTRTGRGG